MESGGGEVVVVDAIDMCIGVLRADQVFMLLKQSLRSVVDASHDDGNSCRHLSSRFQLLTCTCVLPMQERLNATLVKSYCSVYGLSVITSILIMYDHSDFLRRFVTSLHTITIAIFCNTVLIRRPTIMPIPKPPRYV